jgi:hypothetical protein
MAVLLAVTGLLGAGSAAALAVPAAVRTHWVLEPTASRARLDNQLNGVSCTSARACIAVGGPPLGLPGRAITIAERWDGRRWGIQPTPNPRGAAGASLWGVSCPSPRMCMAVGLELAGKIFRTLAERWNGSRWSIEPTPSPASAISADLLGVSCPAANECFAVGDYNGATGPVLGLIERWNGSRWAMAPAIRPASASETFLRSVSCSSVSRCTAVGSFELTSSPIGPYPLAELWTGSRWRQQVTSGKGELMAVSCPAFFHCTAVGEQPTQPGQWTMLAMRWNGRGWRAQPTPVPRGASQAFLQGVSCTAVTSCTAAGWAAVNRGFDDVTVAERWNGLRWMIQVTPNAKGTTQSFLSGVWCGSPVTCRAVGYDNTPFAVNALAEGD